MTTGQVTVIAISFGVLVGIWLWLAVIANKLTAILSELQK